MLAIAVAGRMSVFTCECLTTRKRICCCSICGAISLILTIFFALVLGFGLTDDLFFLIIKKDLQLTPDSSLVDDWADSDVPTYITIHIFDNLNPDEFSEGAVPVVSEVGPFVYRDYDKKENLEWNSDESLVTYNRIQYYTFVPEKSIGDPSDYNITVLNVPLLIVLNQQHKIEDLLFRKLGSDLAHFYLTMIRNQTLFVKKTAQEIIWGYRDPMMSMLQLLGLIEDSFISVEANITNSTLLYTVHTGKKDLKFVDSAVQWRNMTKIDQWGSEYASHISGSLSGHFEPRIESHDKPLTVFAEPLFRHLEMTYVDQAPLHGIKLHRYEAAHTSFSNSSEYPPNAGYYAYNYKYGVVNLTAISFQNLPMYFSKPHCIDCDPEYFRNVSGYHPDKSKHEPYIRIEPFTGLILEAALHGQTNIRIERNLLTRQLSHVPDVTIYPWFYASREGTIPKDKANDFKLGILLPRTILKITAVVFLSISGLTMLYVTGVLIRSYRNNRKLWNNGGICGPPSEIIKKSNPPVEINHSNDHTPLLLDNKMSKGFHTIRQSML